MVLGFEWGFLERKIAANSKNYETGVGKRLINEWVKPTIFLLGIQLQLTYRYT